MSKYKAQGFKNTFKNARKGMRLAIRSERNIRVHLATALFIMLLGVFLGLDSVKICILLLTVAMVVSMEMINSAIEFSLDAVFHNRYSKLVGMAKDISAGAVMFVTIVAVVIGCLIFLPAILDKFF